MTTVSTLTPVPFDLSEKARGAAADALNGWLVDLVALALRLKQAHWNLRGARFKSVHEQLDEILADVRTAVDDVAERVVTLGAAADGRPETVASKTTLERFPPGRLSVVQAIRTSCSDLAETIKRGRSCQERLAEVDPVIEDLSIGIFCCFEKHYCMFQSQEEPA